MALLPVDKALERLLDGVEPLPCETVALADAYDRVLAEPIIAMRTQPPFNASAMDGYAVRGADVQKAPALLKVIGEVAAGHNFAGTVGSSEAVRIFTGAPLPDGADTVVIQENVSVLDGNRIEVSYAARHGGNVRSAGLDFVAGDRLLDAGHVLGASALSLAASANYPQLDVVKQPLVATIATGDELLPPGSTPGPGQIISSNAYGVMGSARSVGARALHLGIAADRKDAIAALVRQAVSAGANVIVTLGGASVGDHDLVHKVLTSEGMELDFWKIAMRPGKPFMFGRMGAIRCIGLPGNPVASLVCSQLFVKPLLARLGGRPFRQDIREALLGAPIAANDRRQDYVRATLAQQGSALVATPFQVQDSSMLRTMATAGCLIVREPFAPAAEAGAPCHVLCLS
ncbi:molybdenum cofactor biosynthesis protein MoaA [Mesorhizobium sp. Root157]|uniref:molybdopterin molybdotransferase MoeA n=1 Tax=Mesorhizobium sp. Root157 TaxID=1736477 RepID=UPI0006F956EE|nr:gephyrin-like molybdotransferase Glp [Mesorhizobium sp. Root157]KQZ99646.1 molybdenum cofactor biosynthesis protein MoaA [Mesorhizobium sp. Root157]